MPRPGKEYITWEEFTIKLKMAGMDEHSFIREVQLGLYTTKEWKRSKFVPYWAGQYLTLKAMVGEGATQKITRSMVLAQITEEEWEIWNAAEREGQQAVIDRLYAAAKDRAQKRFGGEFEDDGPPAGLIG